jgi:hypothetical protein
MGETINGALTRTSVITPVTSTNQLIQAHQSVIQPVSGQQDLFTLVKQAYPWFAKKNQVEAQPYLDAACIARQYGVQQQVILYANMILKIVTRDRAEWTLQVVRRYIGYPGQITARPDDQPLPIHPFTVPIPPAQLEKTSGRYQWIYYPIASYSTLIPPAALQALTLVEEYGAPAQAYWVADKVKVQSTQRRIVDPILCAQYGRWFVHIFEWK